MNRVDLDRPDARVLGRILRSQAEEIPEALYLVAGEVRYSYGQANALCNAYAAGFRRTGVKRGDTVALLMKPSPACVLTTFAVNKLGAVWVPTNTDYRGNWLRTSLAGSQARVLVVDAELLPRAVELGRGLPFERIVVHGEAGEPMTGVPAVDLAEFAHLAKEEPDVDIAYGDTAAVLWTSGTTGGPKGVMQSHNAWVHGSTSAARTFQLRESDVLYSCLPMYNSAAWVGNVYPALVTGLPLAIDDHFSVAEFWDRTRYYGATHIFTLGAMHIFLWKAPARADDRDNPVRVASAIPMPDRILQPFKERFGIEVIAQGYGQSEAFTILTRVDDGSRTWEPGSSGVPQQGYNVRLLDDDDEEVPVGEIGEFCVRPDNPNTIFNGYFGDPEATLASFRNLWYHTGDLGRRGEGGEFFFFDRKADYVRYKGRNISSFAVEAAINAHPAVVESAAYGVPSAELESEAEIKVEVILRPGQKIAPEELARFVNDNAPYFFVPRYIEFVDNLPHTPTGRLRKFELRNRGVTERTWDREEAGFVVRR